jgi:hypothetical protein
MIFLKKATNQKTYEYPTGEQSAPGLGRSGYLALCELNIEIPKFRIPQFQGLSVDPDGDRLSNRA